jgi:hypothetical protein
MTKFLFQDEAFSFEAPRAAGFARYGGADLGEVLAIANAIGSAGTEDAWQREWAHAGARAQSLAEASLARGHRVSAREAFLRASNYFRTAEFFLRNNPTQDPAVKELFGLSRKTFAATTKLMDGPVEPIKISYTSTTLPGYLFVLRQGSRVADGRGGGGRSLPHGGHVPRAPSDARLARREVEGGSRPGRTPLGATCRFNSRPSFC